MLSGLRQWITRRLLGMTEEEYAAGNTRAERRRVSPLGISMGFEFCATDARRLVDHFATLFLVAEESAGRGEPPAVLSMLLRELKTLAHACRGQQRLWAEKRGALRMIYEVDEASGERITAAAALRRRAQAIEQRCRAARLGGEGPRLLAKLVRDIDSNCQDADSIG